MKSRTSLGAATARRAAAPAEGQSRLGRAVCHLIASNFQGGPEKQILAHCGRLQDDGWRPVVGSFRENRGRVDIIDTAGQYGLPTFLIDTRSSFSPWAVRQLQVQLAANDIAVLVTHGYKPTFVGWLACRGSRVAQVPFVRGYTAENWRVRRYEELDRWMLRRFPHLLCVSEGTRRRLVGHGIAEERITVVHNAVDCQVADAVHPIDLHAAFELPAAARVIVAAGRLSPEKGHRLLVEAMALLLPHQPQLHLALLGSGPEELALRRQAQQNGTAAHIHFAGFRRDALACLAGADLVVNPSWTEGLPNVLLEAFSVGKAVVATDVGGTAELVQHGESGWLVPPGDAAHLAAAIRAALGDTERLARMGAAARQRAEAHFSFQRQLGELTRVYDALINGRDFHGRT